MQLKSIAGPAVVGGALALVRCSSVASDDRIGVDAPSGSQQQFWPVADYLDQRCGTLDCHGTIGRNLRIWGCEGMRLDPKSTPLSCLRPNQTTAAEYNATYRSLVGLEPAVMSYVFDHQGQDPELLTFVRKARGIESHKGGTLITPGDPQDNCITSWLKGKTDVTQCAMAITYPMFPMGDASVE